METIGSTFNNFDFIVNSFQLCGIDFKASMVDKSIECKLRFKNQQFFRSKIQPNHIVVSLVLSTFSFSSSCFSVVLI
jgi:hypothetical protein